MITRIQSLCSAAAAVLLFAACSRETPLSVIDDTLAARSVVPDPEARVCAECHADIVAEWESSQHAHANRLVSVELDAEAFTPERTLHHGSFVTTMRQRRGVFEFIESFSNQPPVAYRAEAVIAITPLRQYLVPFPGGRLQVMDVSYDPRSNDWFNAFGNDNRQPHEWGHWKNRSMTWNVQCAFCHTTGFEKHYDIETDSYASTWNAMGISCAQCHTVRSVKDEGGGMKTADPDACPMVIPFASAEHSAPSTKNQAPSTQPYLDNCASCHARREELFGTFRPGDAFDDHYRLTLPDTPRIFHHDGQVLDEDFEYASFRMSRMGHMGVQCLDCHNPHSGKLILPVENNALCLQCHAPPGVDGATPIHPFEHSFHAADNAGSRCVECHMPVNFYMVRDGRRDHGFTSPDPRLTIEYGIPNACNRCHDDQTPEWAEQWTTEWYGDKMDERRARHRTRVVARAHEGDPGVVPDLLAMAQSEEIAAWRSALNGLLEPWVMEPGVADHLRLDLAHPDALVRSAAIRSLQRHPGAEAWIKPFRKDPAALVRVDAAWATLNPRERDAGSYAELRAYLRNIADQPPGALRNAQFEMTEGRPAAAELWAQKALDWDHTPVPHYAVGRIQHILGKTDAARSNLTQAATLAPESAEYSYALALFLAEEGDTSAARDWLEATVQRAPEFGRAWYNLGLAFAAEERLEEAVQALARGGDLMPENPEPPFALATVYARQDKPAEARNAAREALRRQPAHMPSIQFLRQLPDSP